MRRNFGLFKRVVRHVSSSHREGHHPRKLSLLGVPEQVNIPIQLCEEKGIFSRYGLDVNYTTVPEGTGAMLKKLHNNEADIAITVTDGFMAGQAAGFNVQLVGTYVDSPLTWAICAHPSSPFQSLEELFTGKKQINVGISRLQSGSHTMSYYMANLLAAKMQYDCTTDVLHPKNKLNFKVLGSFSNLRNGVTNKDIDIFLWEVFTTKPFFDSGELKYIDEVSTPWPAFSIVASKTGIFQSAGSFGAVDAYRNRFLPALAEGAALFKRGTLSSSSSVEPSEHHNSANIDSGDSVSLIMKRFGHHQFDAKRWLDMTQYALPKLSVDEKRMKNAMEILQDIDLVPSDYCVSQLWEDENGSCNNAISFRRPLVSDAAVVSAQEKKKKMSSLITSEMW